MTLSKAMSSYLERYADCDLHLSPKSFLEPIRSCVVLPAFNETARDVLDCVRSLTDASNNDSLLIVLVLNMRKHSEIEVFEKSKEIYLHLSDKFDLVEKSHNQSLLRADSVQIVVLDHFSEEHRFEDNQGVGLARKIGCDFALRLHSREIINTNWLWTTDCDARVPANYFALNVDISIEAVAQHFNFRHDLNGMGEEAAQALALYEISIRYYRLGLQFAGSEYAHHSIGSCLSFSFDAYAQVRGFPRRLAGEDFYILNKLRKLGVIETSDSLPISLKARPELRTPFGTAAGTQNTLEAIKSSDGFRLYDPECFYALEVVLLEIEKFSRHQNLETFESRLKKESSILVKSLSVFDFRKNFAQLCRQHKNPSDLYKALIENFDGFRQLKFINEITRLEFPRVNYKEALQEAEFVDDLSDFGPLPLLSQIQEMDEKSVEGFSGAKI